MRSTVTRVAFRGTFIGVCLAASTMTVVHAQVWTNIGPSGATSPNIRITSVAVDPSNPNRWLVGAGTGGVFETVDAGRTFVPVSDHWPTQDAGAISFSLSDPKVIYVGTGEPGHYGRAHGGVGIVKSTDGGQSWTLNGYSSFARNAIKRIRVHPANPDVVLAASVRGGFGREHQADVESDEQGCEPTGERAVHHGASMRRGSRRGNPGDAARRRRAALSRVIRGIRETCRWLDPRGGCRPRLISVVSSGRDGIW